MFFSDSPLPRMLAAMFLAFQVMADPYPTTPGFHQNLAVEGLSHRCHLYLPVNFDSESPLRYPVLVLQSPSGRTQGDFSRFIPWADREGVVLVGINGPRNGMPDHEKPPIQDRTLRALTAALPLHPTLRFATGMSGGAADGWRMIRRQPRNFAGVVMQGSAVAPGENHRNLLFVIHYGAKDEWDVRGIYASVLPALERFDIPFWKDIDVDRGHQWAPTGEQHRALTWMVNQARLTHTRFDPKEIDEHRHKVAERVRGLLESNDTREMEAFLRIEPLPLRTELATHYLNTILSGLDGLNPPAQTFLLQQTLGKPGVVAAEEATLSSALSHLARLVESPENMTHLQRGLDFLTLIEQEKRAGLYADLLEPVQKALTEFIAVPEDAWTAPARTRLDVVTSLIENPRRRVGQ